MYYPLSQIKTNLYTNGNEYALNSTPTTSYIGYYYKTSIGKSYTGKSPQEGSNFELISLKGELLEDSKYTIPPSIVEPILAKPTPNSKLPKERSLPSYNSPKPTQKDYKIGEYQRYFCKKTNELVYLEINKDTYKKLSSSDPKIASDLYNAISTPWTITGDKQTTFNTNKNIITLIERNQKWYGFTNYFRDRFLQYHISEQNENLYTSGGEYTLPDGVVYIGFYHIMSNGNAMTGKEHGTGGDIILKQISSKIPSPVTQTTTTPQVPSRGGGY